MMGAEAVARSRVSNDAGIKINCPSEDTGPDSGWRSKSQRPDWAWTSSWQSEKGDGQISVAGSFEQSSSTLQTLCSPFPVCTVVERPVVESRAALVSKGVTSVRHMKLNRILIGCSLLS